MDKSFKFSVVMPLYNVEAYLREAIDSVVGQTIGFEDNIQLILVNDGSTDGSEQICLEYQEKYPNNITYVYQENAGVSAARNAGMKYIEGEIVNFFDSDDVWEKDAFQKAYAFFERHEEIDVATVSIQRFEQISGNHMLNYRMEKGERVADVSQEDEFDSIVTQVSTSFFRANSIDGLKFNEEIYYGEDSLFINTIILEKLLIGFIPEVIYYYRRRTTGDSAVQQSRNSSEFFLKVLDEYHATLVTLSKDAYGEVVPYIQNVIYYDLAWRLRVELDGVLNSEERRLFLEKAHMLMSEIDDIVFLNNRVHRNFVYKEIAYEIKYGRSLIEDITISEGGRLHVHEQLLMDLSQNPMKCSVRFLEIDKKRIFIEGRISKWLLSLGFQFVVSVNSKDFKPRMWEDASATANTIDGKQCFALRFSATIPLEEFDKEENINVRTRLVLDDHKYILQMQYGQFIFSRNSSRWLYRQCDERSIYFPTKSAIVIQRPKHLFRRMLGFELREQRWLRKEGLKDIAKYRRHYLRHKRLHKPKKEIWLLSDRIMNAGDNGEVFFKYLNSIDLSDVQPVFAISKDAECVPRLKKEGKVVFFESKEYRDTFLDAKKIVSSGASDFTLNPFGEDRRHIQDCFNYKFYYLQHGVACADLSSWLRRDAKNIELLFATSQREANSFINGAYQYTKENVAITGQARFDDLYDEREKAILILPTWRKSIDQSYDQNTTSVYYDGFTNTEYFQFYNSLINHPRLLEKMREKGYKGKFCLHPIHMEQWVDFQGNDVFSINEGYVDYYTEFAKAALTVTDYSSVIFDFAYLRKYIIYAQFDKEQFFNDQIYDEGYFSYENDGFGPVCYDLEETVDALIEAIDADCQVPQKYLERANSFFAYDDRNNCERIYNAILEHNATHGK